MSRLERELFHSPSVVPSQSRRAFVAAIGAAATVGLTLASHRPAAAQTPAAAANRPALARSGQVAAARTTRSRIVLQLSGKLKVADPNPASKKPPREAEVKAESTVDFDERVIFDRDNSPLAAARDYHEASVNAWVAGNASSHQLRPERRQGRLVRKDGLWQQFCPSRTLQPREIDLLRLPINTIVLDELLPESPIKADARWEPSDLIVAELFHLEAVHSSTLSAHVVKIEDGVATIGCEGDVEGTVNSVPTKIKVTGNLQAQVTTQPLVTWVGMSVTETREVSQAEPGFTLTARIKLIRKEEVGACADVDQQELVELASSQDEGRWLLQVASVAGRYQFLADRRWKTIVDTGEEAILRLVENNNVVAQCNITRLPKLAAGQQLTLAGMQEDIKRSLDKSLESILEASERKNGAGLRVLRIVAIGQSSDVPVRWVYSHISDDTGRRVSLVFTMSGEAAEAFALADEQMTGSFELLPEAASGEPTPATEIKAATAPNLATPQR